VKLLGESLVLFCDSDGSLGLLDEFCPHRGTSLWLGRNEQRGLRCVWHGWKFAVAGQCGHQLNESAETSFAHKIHLKSYPTCELGGVIWAYLGPAEKKPPLPRFAWTQVPETHRHASKVIQECNWLQALEGGLDQSHVGILHKSFLSDPNNPGSLPNSFNAREGRHQRRHRDHAKRRGGERRARPQRRLRRDDLQLRRQHAQDPRKHRHRRPHRLEFRQEGQRAVETVI
jgi:phenylpropionate dioxygenase-like ring-hydroxylating dioxygenase large terminal subunit